MMATPGASEVAIPLGDDRGTIRCPVCATAFTPIGRQIFCSSVCRHTAWRRAHRPSQIPIMVPRGTPRRPLTVYECLVCGERAVGEQYCEDCQTFMRRVGLGGRCPHCDEPVAVIDLIEALDKP